GGEKAYTRHVAAWSVHAGDESARDRVVADDKHDRNSRGRRLRRASRHNADCGDYCHLTANQIGRQRRRAVILTVRPAIFHPNVLTLDIASLDEPLSECSDNRRRLVGRVGAEEPNRQHRRLLPARHKRPRARRATKQRDELAASIKKTRSHGTIAKRVDLAKRRRLGKGLPFSSSRVGRKGRCITHSITSLAATSKVCGTVSPSALAVLRLITSWNLVGSCTGRSAGFSPWRMRST